MLRHNLDVIYIEKNFFENIISTIMDVHGKIKDNVKSRMDAIDICYREELHLQPSPSGKMVKPKAKFILLMDKQRELCD